ncbi:MAG: NAD(P)H-hydrate dehydratase [Acidobacteriota bacterium]
MRALSAEEMVAFEGWAMEEIGLPQVVLMENAARNAADVLLERFPECGEVLVLAGPGNNGGDGLAMMRRLLERGVVSRALCRDASPGSLCEQQREWVLNLGLAAEPLTLERLRQRLRERPAVVIDALLGTGLSRPLSGELAEIVAELARSSAVVVAVDVPTGIDASRAQLPGGDDSPVVSAALTVSFAAHKVAHLLDPASFYCGEVRTVGLGVPFEEARLVDSGVLASGGVHATTSASLREVVVPRPSSSHKGTFGHLLVVGGAPGMSGAAVLTARGALRSGAGLVTVGVPEPLLAAVDSASLESMSVGLPATSTGALSPSATAAIASASASRDAVALGPGLGPEAFPAVLDALSVIERPLVLDADGLNALEGGLERVAERSAPTVLTPHPGELARLLGCTSREIQDDRLEAVKEASERSQATVVLKGHQTLVAERGDDDALAVWVNTTGNPGMATGGSGDVLTGVIGSLLAQGHSPLEAARLGVFLHGAAGDRAALRSGPSALTAGDIVDELGAARQEIEDE